MHPGIQAPEAPGGLPAPQRIGQRAAAAEGDDDVECNGGGLPSNVPAGAIDNEIGQKNCGTGKVLHIP